MTINLMNGLRGDVMYESTQHNDPTSLLDHVIEYLKHEFSIAVREDTLEEFLTRIGYLSSKIGISQDRELAKTVLVIGASRVVKHHLRIIWDESNLNKYNIEFILDYNDIEKFDFKCLQHSLKYCAVLVGPMAHNQRGVEGYPSMIARMEEETDVYPHVIRIKNGRGELKISNNSFREALLELEEKLKTNL